MSNQLKTNLIHSFNVFIFGFSSVKTFLVAQKYMQFSHTNWFLLTFLVNMNSKQNISKQARKQI